VEFNGLKVIGVAAIAIGLLTGAFVVGGLASSGSAEPTIEPTATASAVVAETEEEEEHNPVILVGDERDEDEDEAPAAQEPVQDEAVEPAAEPTQAPAEPTAVPATPEPTPAPPTPEPPAVNEAPYVVSISPEDGAIGVAVDAPIVVTFSEAMDKAAAQAALNLSTGNCGAFGWNGDATVMTFTPCGNFAYGSEVEVEVYASAADADGLGMDDDFEGEFKVLQQSTIKLWSEDAYDGYVWPPGVFVWGDKAVADGQYFRVGTWQRGFLSFDLSELPEDLVEVQSATFKVKQNSHQAGAYTNATGWLLIESVTYGTLTVGDWSLPSNAGCVLCLLPILSSDASDGWKSASVTGWVQSDWEHREDRDYNSQFRLRFGNDCGDASCGDVSAEFIAGKGNGVVRPYLYVTYTHP
jgi:hypothetical protein